MFTTAMSFAATTETNIALYRPAFMSSAYVWGKRADRGNDGNDNTHFHTNRGSHAWWAVDLVNETMVSRVRIININDYRYSKYSAPIYISRYMPANYH